MHFTVLFIIYFNSKTVYVLVCLPYILNKTCLNVATGCLLSLTTVWGSVPNMTYFNIHGLQKSSTGQFLIFFCE